MDGDRFELGTSPTGSYRKITDGYEQPTDTATDATTNDAHTAVPDVTTVSPISYAGVESEDQSQTRIDGKSPLSVDAKGRLERARSRYVTVELPIVLLAVGLSVIGTLKPQYIQDRVAQDEFNRSLMTNQSVSSCDVNTTHEDAEILAISSHWILILSVISSIPGIFAAIFFGSLSDRIGRKPALTLCLSGFLVSYAWYILIIYFHLSLYAFIPGDLITGLTGSSTLLLATSASYVADVSSTKMRTFRIVLVETAYFIGLGIGQIALGFSVSYNTDQSLTKYILPLWISLGCVCGGLLYVIIPGILIETVDKKTSGKWTSQITMFFSGLGSLFKENTNRRRVKLFSYTSAMMFAIFIVVSMGMIYVLYAIGPPFCFTPLDLTVVNTIGIAASSIGLIAGGAILPKCLSDNWILQLCLFNAALSCLVTGLANTKTTLIIASAIGLFKGLSFPVIRSQLTKISAEHERGLILAFIGCMDGLAAFFSPLVANSIFSATVFFNPAFVFYILTALAIIPCFIVGALQILERKDIPHNVLLEDE